MQTGIFILTFRDGRVYKIFFGNKSQKEKIIHIINTKAIIDYEIINGIHTTKQFLDIIDNQNIGQ